MLRLTDLTLSDAAWLVSVLDNPEFHRFVADRGVRNPADAVRYLEAGPLASYRSHGFGLWAVRTADAVPVGIAGLVRREGLDHPDLGYAILPDCRGRGYATSAARLALARAHGPLGLTRVLAIVDPANHASRRVLARLGFRHQGHHRSDPASERWLELHAHP